MKRNITVRRFAIVASSALAMLACPSSALAQPQAAAQASGDAESNATELAKERRRTRWRA